MPENFIKTELHPDGAKDTTLYPKTVPEQIVGLDEHIIRVVPQGERGEQGPRGPEGPQGPIGPKGEKGDTGAQGPRGPEGPRGPQGEQGVRGMIGAVGPEGPRGQEGPRGPEGPQGIRGPQGPKGDSGNDYQIKGQVDSEDLLPQPSSAYLGYAIFVGITVPRDVYACIEYNNTIQWINQGKLQGPQGEQGEAGPQGPIGPEGRQGPQGVEGRAGNGVVGITDDDPSVEGDYTVTPITVVTDEEDMPFNVYAKNGAQGPKGDTGPQGPKGDTGPQGPNGPTGPTGPQGYGFVKCDVNTPSGDFTSPPIVCSGYDETGHIISRNVRQGAPIRVYGPAIISMVASSAKTLTISGLSNAEPTIIYYNDEAVILNNNSRNFKIDTGKAFACIIISGSVNISYVNA